MTIEATTYRSPLDLVGRTPLVSVGRLQPGVGAEVWAKLESRNPGGSVKDRICRGMVLAAEREGKLKPGAVLVEPTSGNTGIGLAWISAARGYRCILTMPESMSPERVKLLRGYGAEVVLTPHEGGMGAAILKAEELVERFGEDGFMPQQFENQANPRAHRETTGPELLAQAAELGRPISALVAGVGTGGTITGCGEVLKAHDVQTRIVAVEPRASAVLSGQKPGPHRIQGIGAGFIPRVLNTDIIDQIELVDDLEAIEYQRRLAREAGLFVGISAGANVAAALRIAARMPADSVVVTFLCDTGERYLSLDLF